jgi:thiol:disulfide interchange protein DsbD
LSFLKATGVQRSPWWYFLLLAFLGGMILNVMPCVLPVISLKVMSFVRQAEEERGRVLRLGLAYGAGVLASFAALAAAVVALKAAGTQVGWGFQLQEPRFVIAMTAVVLAFALSLFGVFTVELPGAATARLADGASREGYGGSFVSGVLATALATPCVGPLLGVALGFAFTQAAWVIVVFFLTVGAGLAAPYVLLAANPAWLRALPRAGPWMETVKHLMGFALVGTLVWLLSVLGGQLGTQGMAETLAFLAAVALGCWLIGLGQRPWSGRWTSRMTWALALAAVAVGYAFFPGRFLRNWSPEGAGSQRVASLRTTGGIEWLPFSLARVEELVADRRTVFLDFTADWCLTCKVNEKGTLASARVAAAFKRHGVAAVRADWTTRDETIRRVLAQLGASGVPLYVILPAERPEQPIMLPSLLTPGLIEEKLEKAAGTMSVAYNP